MKNQSMIAKRYGPHEAFGMAHIMGEFLTQIGNDTHEKTSGLE